MKQNFEHDLSLNKLNAQVLKYTCPKCGNKQTRRFTFVTCQRCKYTELYKVPTKEIGEVINFMSR